MADRIVVMKSGKIQQIAEPLTIYHEPANLFVAGFIGSPAMNFIRGTVLRRNGRLVFQEKSGVPGGGFSLAPNDLQSRKLEPFVDKPVVLGIRPENIDVAMPGDSNAPDSTLQARLEVMEPMGAETYLYLNTGHHDLTVRSRQTLHKDTLGRDLKLAANMDHARFFNSETDVLIT